MGSISAVVPALLEVLVFQLLRLGRESCVHELINTWDDICSQRAEVVLKASPHILNVILWRRFRAQRKGEGIRALK